MYELSGSRTANNISNPTEIRFSSKGEFRKFDGFNVQDSIF